MIDVKNLIEQYSVEQLNAAAEQYFAVLDDHSYLLSKPFAAADECSRLLLSFAALLQGLAPLLRTMTVMDLGAGSGWVSYLLTQMGIKAHAVDVSPSALAIGRDRFTAHPPFGTQPTPEFHVYDGRRLPLEDGSVDRVLCFDAFHHVPNPEVMIGEIARVLNSEGIAGFAEPGPVHSRTPVAQMEMEKHCVIENDIVVEQIFAWAETAGFKRFELMPIPHRPVRLSLEDYNAFCGGRSPVDDQVLLPIRHAANDTRLFFLFKESWGGLTSRGRSQLQGALDVTLPDGLHYRFGQPIPAILEIRNSGGAVWLPATAGPGGVYLGCHLRDTQTGKKHSDYFRAVITPDPGRPVRPGETIELQIAVSAPPPGAYELEFDLVSEHVCWFAENDGQTVKFNIDVRK